MKTIKSLKHTLSEVMLVFLIAIGWAALSGIEDVVLGLFQVDTKSLPLHLYMVSTLYCEGIAVIAMLIRYRKRPLLLGISAGHRRAIHDYLLGMMLGGIVFATIWALIVLQGGYAIRYVYNIRNSGLIVLYLLGFMIQSLFEELVCRGYIMGYWLERGHILSSILLNALLFMALHFNNPGFNRQAALGIFLFGVLMSLVRLACGNIWLGAAFHAVWNFCEGLVFGTAVSGLPNISLIIKSVSDTSHRAITGGKFGVESSPTSILVHIVAIIFMLIMIRKHRAAQSLVLS
jgi:membrane protease YdiL (CAAX protease family)